MSEREAEALRLRAEIFKALGHPTRLWIVERLAEGECCVADLAAGVEGGLSAVSQHLALLRQTGIVRDTRKGRQIYYSLTFPCVAEMCTMLGGVKPKRENVAEKLRKMLPLLLLGTAATTLFLLGHAMGVSGARPADVAQVAPINDLSVVIHTPTQEGPSPATRVKPRIEPTEFRYAFPAPHTACPCR